MKTKVKIYPNGWEAMLEKAGPWYCANVRNAAGGIHDKVRCDDYRAALDYYRAFSAIAKNATGTHYP
jgi:hypothetical protein